MTRPAAPAPSDPPESAKHVRKRWLGRTDENGEPTYGSEVDVNDEWFDTPPACLDGNPQRLCHPLGFRERNPSELELGVLLGGHDRGVCQVIVDEHDAEVHVRVLVCQAPPASLLSARPRAALAEAASIATPATNTRTSASSVERTR